MAAFGMPRLWVRIPLLRLAGEWNGNTIPGSYPERYWVRLPGSATENIIRLVTANFSFNSNYRKKRNKTLGKYCYMRLKANE